MMGLFDPLDTDDDLAADADTPDYRRRSARDVLYDPGSVADLLTFEADDL